MNAGDAITIPYPIMTFQPPLPALKGKETGKYLRTIQSGLGKDIHEVEINGLIYPLWEEEFVNVTSSEKL